VVAVAERNPKTWKEMSVDFRLFFVYHGCMMVLFATGGLLTLQQEILITLSVVGVLASISAWHRRASHWHWPGIRARDLLSAAGGPLLISFFLYAATPLFPPSTPQALPWYLAGLGIGVFGILASLKVVCSSKAGFAAQCWTVDQYGREIEPVPAKPTEGPVAPKWKKVLRGTYSALFLLVWLGGISSFYFFGTSFRNGSPVPTATQTEPLEDGGKTVYVTRAEKQRVDYLQRVWWGIPVVLAFGAVLHFFLGVKVFSNEPDSSEA
jgi:hypothetical protein